MRLAQPGDAYAALARLRAMKLKSPAAQMKYTDEDSALAHMLKQVEVGHAVVEQGYFILFDIGRPWYSKHDFLMEDLIIRIQDTDSPVSVAIDALSVLASYYSCVAVVAGDTQIGHMVPHYHTAGFVTLGQQLIKEM